MVQLSIIILSYNTKDLTLSCIKSISQQYKKQLENGEIEIIIADNNSQDNSVLSIISAIAAIKNIKLIENKENLGFSKGNNNAALQAKGKYLIFLNSDTEVLDNGLLGMVEFLNQNENVGILGGKLLNLDGTVQKSAGNFYNLFNVFLMLFGGEKLGLLRKAPINIENVDWVSGASLMIRKNVYEKVKGFDENIFMYMEDMELCYNTQKNGYKVYYFPVIKIMHKERGSSNKTYAIISIYKGLLYFYKKHKSYIQYLLVKKMLFLKSLIAIILGVIIGSSYLKETYRSAIKITI